MKGASWRETSMVMLAQALAASGKDDEAAGATESKGSKQAQEKVAHVAGLRRAMSSLRAPEGKGSKQAQEMAAHVSWPMRVMARVPRRSTKAAQPAPAEASTDPSEVVIQRHELDDDGVGRSSTPAVDLEPPATPRAPKAPAASPMAAQRESFRRNLQGGETALPSAVQERLQRAQANTLHT